MRRRDLLKVAAASVVVAPMAVSKGLTEPKTYTLYSSVINLGEGGGQVDVFREYSSQEKISVGDYVEELEVTYREGPKAFSLERLLATSTDDQDKLVAAFIKDGWEVEA